MFIDIRKKMQAKFEEISKGGVLFQVEIDKDKIWETYLGAFPEQYRQGNNCNCCKSFLRQFAGIVGLKNNEMITLWDFEPEDEEYNDAIAALREYIRSLPISGIFVNTFKKCGTDKTPDSARNLVWNHFYFELPQSFVKPNVGPLIGDARANKDVLKRSLEEITDDAVDTTVELINQGSIYRGNEFLGLIQEFRKVKAEYKKTKAKQKDNFCWAKSTTLSAAICRINNSAIGTLLGDLSGGEDINVAVTKFERVVAPTNYKRTTSIATPKMIEDAKKRLKELGLIDSLSRRVLSDADLTANNTLFVHRAKGGALTDVFDELKKDVTVNPKTLSKVEEVSIKDFVEKILPTAKSVSVLLENSHLSNFTTLIGPQNDSDKKLFKWNNNFSWSFTGGVADSIKERVKEAGGNVDGILRVSLSWDNTDDLDLHVLEPGGKYRIYYSNRGAKSPSGGTLDIDANGLSGMREDPVENIYWINPPTIGGEFEIIVNQYSKRSAGNQGFTVQVEYDGETYHFSKDSNGLSGTNHKIAKFTYTKSGGFSISGADATPSKYQSKEKWGLSTGQFHKVRAITLSPNHWETNVGNKIYLFFLEGCVSDEKPRGFYNEFLTEDLMKDRKVFELLAGKIEVEPTTQELSGLGFSETLRNHIFIEVESKFKRIIKVKF